MWNLNLSLLSLVCPTFPPATLEDLSRVRIGTSTFEKNTGRHLEVSFHTHSEDVLQMVTPPPQTINNLEFSTRDLSSQRQPSLHSSVTHSLLSRKVSLGCTVCQVLETKQQMRSTLPRSSQHLQSTTRAITGALPMNRGGLCSS